MRAAQTVLRALPLGLLFLKRHLKPDVVTSGARRPRAPGQGLPPFGYLLFDACADGAPVVMLLADESLLGDSDMTISAKKVAMSPRQSA